MTRAAKKPQADTELAEHIAATGDTPARSNVVPLAPKERSQLTDDQQRATFFDHLGKVRKARERVASAAGDLRNLYKQARGDGISKKDIDHALRLEDGDEADLIEERRRLDQIARWIGSPVGTQGELFGGTDRTPLVDRANEAGKIAAMKDEPCNVPAAWAGAGEQAWIAGWHAGNEARQEMIRARTEAELNSAEGQATIARLESVGSGQAVDDSSFGDPE